MDVSTPEDSHQLRGSFKKITEETVDIELEKTAETTDNPKVEIDKDPKKEEGSVMTKTFWFGFFTLASVSMVILNKFSIMQLSAPYSILLFQNSMTIFLNFLLVYFEVFKINPFTLEQFRIFALPSLLFVAMLTFSLKAYEAVSVATVVVSRAISTVIVAFCDYILFGTAFTKEQIIFIGVVLFGAMIFGSFDKEGTSYGYLMTGLNMALFIFIQLYEKFQITHSTQTPVGISCVQNIMSVPILLVCVFATDESLLVALGNLPNPSGTAFCLTLTGFAGCALSIIYMTLNKIATATAISLAGNFNKLTSVMIGFFVFSNKLYLGQMVGLVMSMGGTFMYSQDKKKQKKKGSN